MEADLAAQRKFSEQMQRPASDTLSGAQIGAEGNPCCILRGAEERSKEKGEEVPVSQRASLANSSFSLSVSLCTTDATTITSPDGLTRPLSHPPTARVPLLQQERMLWSPHSTTFLSLNDKFRQSWQQEKMGAAAGTAGHWPTLPPPHPAIWPPALALAPPHQAQEVLSKEVL